MMSWGAITTGTGWVNNYPVLVVTRFLLGVFEAGLFPGLVYYLTFWYRSDERSFRIAIIMASSTLAGAFGGAIAYGERNPCFSPVVWCCGLDGELMLQLQELHS